MGLSNLRDRWAAYRRAKTHERLKNAALGDATERLVQESLPSIRRVGGYRQQLLAEIDQLLQELGPDAATPESILREMKAVLNNPGSALTGKPLRLCLDGMGCRLDDEANEGGSGIDLAELEVPGRIKRVAVLATIPAGECPRA